MKWRFLSIPNLFHLDLDDAGAEGGDFLEGDFVEVDDAVFAEWSAVIDTNDDGLAVLGIGDADVAPNREPGVCGGERPGETIP